MFGTLRSSKTKTPVNNKFHKEKKVDYLKYQMYQALKLLLFAASQKQLHRVVLHNCHLAAGLNRSEVVDE